MRASPTIRNLSYIRVKDARHAEALDDLSEYLKALASYVDLSPLSGPVDGINKVFLLPSPPNPVSSLHLFKYPSGSLLLPVQDYAISGRTVSLVAALTRGQFLRGSYRT